MFHVVKCTADTWDARGKLKIARDLLLTKQREQQSVHDNGNTMLRYQSDGIASVFTVTQAGHTLSTVRDRYMHTRVCATGTSG